MKPSGHGVWATCWHPPWARPSPPIARNLAMMRVAEDCQRACAISPGAWPRGERSGRLSLPKEATIDPFSGEPLKLKHTDDGWVIYTVMQNGIDDGGDFKDQKDYGLAPQRIARIARGLSNPRCRSIQSY